MTLDEAFAELSTAFPKSAVLQGLHFVYAERNGVSLIEIHRANRFFYWLLWDGQAKLIHASYKPKLRSMQTVGASFKPSLTIP